MRTIGTIIIALLLLTACRHDELVSFITEETTHGAVSHTDICGLYVLNEGNMGSNKCTLDYLDLSDDSQGESHYYRNIYGARNPNTVMELGDVGNDIAIYGDKLWMVINCSNKVEVCEARTARRIGQVNIANARYLAFDDGFAYVSSYAGPVQIAENTALGRVYKVDTLTLQKVDSVTVGYQPEEMAIADGLLYVANSGGYRVPHYDNTVSVIDLHRMEVTHTLQTEVNLHRLKIDRHGTLWISSRGNYLDHAPALCWIAQNGETGRIDRAVSDMDLVGDTLYCIGSAFDIRSGQYRRDMFVVDVRTKTCPETTLFEDPAVQGMTMPYGIIVNPRDKDIYLMDAKNYVSSGELLHLQPDGHVDWKVRTGDIPSSACFLITKK